MLDNLISLRNDVVSYLKLFIKNKAKNEVDRAETLLARKMMLLKEGLDKAIATLEANLKSDSAVSGSLSIDDNKTPIQDEVDTEKSIVQEEDAEGSQSENNSLEDNSNNTNTEKEVDEAAPSPQKVSNSTQPIRQSVGNKGKNSKEDTLIIQNLLNQHGAKLVVDGLCGKATIAAIQSFQKSKLGFKNADGRVDPAGKTWKGLSGETAANPEDNKTVTKDPAISETETTETETTETTQPANTGAYSYYHHKNWESSNYTLGTGRTAKPLNATAARLLKNILAGAGIKSARVTSTMRTYSDQAYIVLSEVSTKEAYKWYSWIRNNKSVFEKYKSQHNSGVNKEKIYAEYGEWIKKNVGLGASNHLSGIALDIAGCDLVKFNAFASTLVPISGSGVKKIFPESGRTHVEFTFKVT